jgi:hypothetical protein
MNFAKPAAVRPAIAGVSGLLSSFIYVAMFLGFISVSPRPASALPITAARVYSLPAFARKYDMPCSACHDSWPRLSPFGQAFKDNGYQLMNDRDAPIYQNPSYWPVTFRITPEWHRVSNNRVAVDGATPGTTVESQVTTHGFDWTGLDFHTAGTLAKNFSFYVLPSSDSTGAFHFEAVFARVDNIFGSSWFNLKFGKFELDNLHSEKRILTLSDVGGSYQNYHFQPVGESNYVFGLGDNQVGLEWMGHSKNDRTRISATLTNGNDGQPNFNSNNGGGGFITGKAYDGYFAASQAFQIGSLGLQRVGGFAFIGQAPTYFQFTQTTTSQVGTDINGNPVTSTSTSPVNGSGIGNKPFYRAGFIGMWFVKKFDVTTMYFYGKDSAYLGTNTAANAPLPTGAQSPSWNGALIEPHYTVNPRLVFTGRYEAIRMSKQAIAGTQSNLGDVDAGTAGFRFYPFISSRAGFAFHGEYSLRRQRGVAPVSGLDLTTSSVFAGFDFAF